MSLVMFFIYVTYRRLLQDKKNESKKCCFFIIVNLNLIISNIYKSENIINLFTADIRALGSITALT